MREIRVRAWDSETKKMYDGDALEAYDFLQAFLSYGKLVISSTDKHGNYYELDVMQYTGLADRNGKEIYEGDILNVQHMLVETVTPYRAVVEWDKYRFALRNLGVPDFRHSIYPMYNLDPFGLDLEIIGNRFESPELLKGE